MNREDTQTTQAERLAYGLYFVGQNMIYLFVANYLQNYFTDVVGMAAGTVAIIFLLARIWDSVNDPLFGVIVDRSRLKGGRFLPWLRVSNYLIPLTTILLFCVPYTWPLQVKTLFCAFFYILWDMAFTLCDVPAHSLPTAMTSNINERTALTARGRFFSVFGILTVMLLTVPLVNVFTGAGSNVPVAWLLVSVLFSVVAFAFMFRLGRVAQERCIDQESEPLSARDMLAYIKGNKYLLIFYGALIIATLTNTTTALLLYFANVNLGNSNLYVPLVAVFMIGSPLVSLSLAKINKRVDKYAIFMFGLALNIVASVATYFVGYEGDRFVPFLILCAVKGVGVSCSTVMSFMFASDCVEYGTYVSGVRAEGITFAIQTFTIKLTGAVSGFVAMGLLGWLFNYQSAYYVGSTLITPQQPESVARGIWILLSVFPAVGALAAFLILLFFYRLRDKDVQIAADVNSGKITREQGETLLKKTMGSRKW